MKTIRILGWCSALCLSASWLQAQQTTPDAVDTIRRQLEEATRQFNQSLQEHQKTIEALKRRLEELESKPSTAPPPGPPAVDSTAPAKYGVVGNAGWKPSDPIRVGRGNAYMDMGLVGTFAVGTSTAEDIEGGLELGGHDPNQRGFTVQEVEATFNGVVDPYFIGTASVTLGVDGGGETITELEEGYVQSLALPWDLQVRGGYYLTEFGRHNTLHLHSFQFADLPLVNGRLLGPDGLRNPGARVSWLAPTRFYSELFLSVQNSQGATATSFRGEGGHGHGGEEDAVPLAYRHPDNDRGVHNLGDMLYGPRYVTAFDLGDTQTLRVGGSALFGPNSRGGEDAGETQTQVYGADVTWKWKPLHHHGGFPFVQWETEFMWRRYDAGAFDWDENGDGVLDPGEVSDPATGLPAELSGETLDDYGFYTQLLYGFRKGWVAGLRWDHVGSPRADYEDRGLLLDGAPLGRDPQRAPRWRLSPNLTWYPSEFTKLRLQYNYDHRNGIGDDHSVWLQMEFILGAHAAHAF